MFLISHKKTIKTVLAVIYLVFSIVSLGILIRQTKPQPDVFSGTLRLKQVTALLLFVVISFILFKPSAVLGGTLVKKLSKKYLKVFEHSTKKYLGLWILLAAATGLFAELMVIRLHSIYFPVFGFYKNVTLLSCFLGLGIGYAWGKRKTFLAVIALPLFAIQIIFIDAISSTPLQMLLLNPVAEQLTMGLAGVGTLDHAMFVYFFLAVIFSFNALCFIPLGQLVSWLMSKKEKLIAYSWNLAGSLLGIFLFSLLSFIWTPPLVWIMVMALLLLFLFRNQAEILTISTLSLIVIIAFISLPTKADQKDIYSPYQILTLNFKPEGYASLEANNTFFQLMVDLKKENIINDSFRKSWADYYNATYSFKPNPNDVLIVGSGVGNDVAAAIRNGAKNIDAVEIDPAILKIGENLHPEFPYSSARVNPIVADARSFMKQTKKKYDLIVYGLLDSHTLLSGKSSVRLDSFVYTVEAFREARDLLREGGLISLTFVGDSEEFGRKIYLMLKNAFDGQAPIVYKTKGFTFITGENIDRGSYQDVVTPEDITDIISSRVVEVDESTDDWPFFYMPTRKYPATVVLVLVVLLGISLIFTFYLIEGSKVTFSVPAFFLGAGFMLIETKAITELALFYGSTWFVVSIVITLILILAFLANWTVIKRERFSLKLIYVLLLLSVILGYSASSLGSTSAISLWSKLVISILITVPVYFSGLAFSSELKRSISIGHILSSNLLGAMLGGFLEYNSMYFGFQFLYILAFILYGLAFFSSVRSRR